MKKLSDSVSALKGVGARRQKDLAHLGINTIEDLLTYFPFRYDDFKPKDLSDIADQQKVTLKGQVMADPIVVHYGYRRSRMQFRLLIGRNPVRVTFFNQPWLKKDLHAGQSALVYGKFYSFRQSMVGIKVLSNAQSNQMGAIYPASKGIRQSTIKKLIKMAYDQYYGLIKTYLPPLVQHKYRLESERTMIHDMHFPKDRRAEFLARRTAKFNEFFLFQMRLQAMKQIEDQHRGVQIHYQASKIGAFIRRLPYQLTPAQRKVIGEIDHDLSRPIEMNRLLQGDVGSGKTVVAAIAIYATITAGYQAALMAPTEILAEQHANNFVKAFKGLGINIALLTGDTKPAARKELLPRLANGQIDLVIGTHALIQKEVRYHRLGLAVIDEQHRFGVNQRQALRKKGRNPNVLAMTATPIPRTLALTAYGDMDVSIIDQLPKGRKPVKTRWIRSKQFSQVLPYIKRFLSTHQQIYIVAPLIKPSEAVSMVDATSIYQRFKKYLSPKFSVGLLDGQMKDDQKNQIMKDFAADKYQVLVSTTVIEVGVDVANANMMIIFNADHFGLSQLHQLRGRVGRSNKQAYCLLIADPKGNTGKKRMSVMEKTNNGFIVSQEDLKLRGPGQVLGKVQSGIPQFKVADPIADEVILSCAQQEAIKIVSVKNWQKQPINRELIRRLRMDRTTTIFD